MSQVFRSRIDGALLMVAGVMPIVAVSAVAGSGHLPAAARLAVAGSVLAVTALIAWVVFSTYYEIDATALTAHAGPLSWRVPLDDITGVRASRTARSGPAMSMDRLEVAFGAGRILVISPADQKGFLAALRHRVPRLAD